MQILRQLEGIRLALVVVPAVCLGDEGEHADGTRSAYIKRLSIGLREPRRRVAVGIVRYGGVKGPVAIRFQLHRYDVLRHGVGVAGGDQRLSALLGRHRHFRVGQGLYLRQMNRGVVMAQFPVCHTVHGKGLGQLKEEDTVRAAVGDGDLAVFHHSAHVGLGRPIAYQIPDLIAIGRLHRQVDRVVEIPPVAVADHRVAVFHRGLTGGPQGIAHLGSSVQCEGAGVGLDAHILISGDGHLKGAFVFLEGTPLVLGVVPLAVFDGCPPLRRDFHGFGAAVVRVKNLGDGVDIRRCNGRVEGKWLTEETFAGLIIIVSDSVAPRRDIQKTAVHRIICAAGVLIGIQPAVAQAHDGAALQVLDGIGVFAVPGQLRGHQHDLVSARGADVVHLRKGQILIGVAGLLGHAFVPLEAVVHIAQGGARLHGVTHRHQHHILLDVGEGLDGVRPACAGFGAGGVQGVIPIEELALCNILTPNQYHAPALGHNMDVVELRLHHLGVVELAAVWIIRRRMRVHSQAGGLLHGGNAGGGIDILGAAPRVFRGISPGLDQNAYAVVAAVHILP